MNKLISSGFIFSLVMINSACQQTTTHVEENKTNNVITSDEIKPIMSEEELEVVNQMQWLKTADAKADAEKVLKNNKPELIAFSGRGKSFPGLSNAQYESIKDKVTYRFAEGSGDVLYGETHKALRMKLKEYVKTYNTIIFNALNQ